MSMRISVALGLSLSIAAFTASAQRSALPACDPDDGGLTLPPGFCALVVADNLGPARHLTVAPNGDVHVMMTRQRNGTPGGIMGLRDLDGDGRADERQRIGTLDGTEVRWHEGYLYLSSDTAVGRYQMAPGQLLPTGEVEIIVTGLPEQRAHASKSFTFDDAGHLYVNVGAPSNACQSPDRRPGVPGQDPCLLLERHGGIWRFDANKPGQTQEKDGYRFATGLRNVVAIATNPLDRQIYVVQHGRDQLDQVWPDKFTAKQNAELPAEELFRLSDGADFGWPKCYFDLSQKRRVLGPEYGGDGKQVGPCGGFGRTLVAFPAHTAPNDMVFYTGSQFPEKYRNGAFVAFHGSWNRAPEPQEGYNVMFAPWKGVDPTGTFEIFADGFAEGRKDPRNAPHRPTGLAMGPDGSLYVSNSRRGKVWRIIYKG